MPVLPIPFRFIPGKNRRARLMEPYSRTGWTEPLISPLLFFGEFLRAPFEVASVAPSSRKLAARLLDRIDWRGRRLIVELGPGTGDVTAALLERMEVDALLVAIESNARFCDHLHSRFDDPRLVVIHGSACDIEAILVRRGTMRDRGPVDCIVSGLPFSTLPPPEAARLLDRSRDLLAPDGIFAAYQLKGALRGMLCSRFERVESETARPRLLRFELLWAMPGRRTPARSGPEAGSA